MEFIEKLLVRLKTGDARSIHLNALPGNFARLDIYDLMNIESSLHLKFLENLLTKPTFKFSITIEPSSLNSKTADEKKIIQKIIKRLNRLDYQEKEEFSEHGYHSFGFGYPLLIKRDPNNPDRILKAPLLIWYLDIEKDSRKNNTWTIIRDEQHPLIFNELLQSHFESIEKIKTEDLELLIEDDFLDEPQLNQFCKQLLEKLNIPFNATENIATLLPSTNKETIESVTKETAWIRWSGVFGLYKMQKQAIIKDVENLLERQEPKAKSQDNADLINEPIYFDGEVLTPVSLDPSQENVLQQVKQHNTIIIQGPPGTGKSQSLTAIITQALLNKQKVLVVCEKRTAMEVLYNNLKKENLHHLCVLIEDVYSDRKNIVERVRDIIENTEQTTVRFRANEYELARSKFLSLQEELNHRINFSNEEIFGDDNWSELLNRSYLLNRQAETLDKANAINKIVRNGDYAFTYDEYRMLVEKLNQADLLFKQTDPVSNIFDEINSSHILNSSDHYTIINELKAQHQLASALKNKLSENIAIHGSNFNVLYGWRNFLISFLSVFSPKHKQIKRLKEEITHEYQQLKSSYTEKSLLDDKIEFAPIGNTTKAEDLIPVLTEICENTQQIISSETYFENFFNYKKFFLQQDIPVKNIIMALITRDNKDWKDIFTAYYLNQTILKTALQNGIKDDAQKLYDELKQTDNLFKQKLSEKINFIWNETIQNTIKTKDLSEIKYLYNQRKNKQFSSKNSLRKIIHQDFDFFTTLFPVLMVNPTVCTSILPLQQNLFDFIILDEASQLRLEDTYSSLLRGKTKIISGDKHQMPPSNFFGNETIFWNEEEESAEDFLAESKSLLEYADDANYKSSYLDYHYRSLHPNLIQFSNHAFYQSRLIPLPEKENYQSIFYKNVDGIYKDGTNEKEAEEIVDFIFSSEKTNDEYPGIGIATFNIYQRDLIFDKLYEHAYADKAKNEKLQSLLNKGLFVKNLENIQGDERDIMVLSTTFGKDETGKFRQFFGPLTQEKGYQLLNVIITRAKHSLYVFSSIPEITFAAFEEELAQKGNKGKSIFYAYLSYVKACAENNEEQKSFIKSCLQKNNQQVIAAKQQQVAVFKNLVFTELQKKYGENIRQNYPLGGFVLDIVLLKNNQPVLYIDFENTQNYHPEVSYRIKLHQQKIVETYNIKTYHLWSYNWWKDAQKEMDAIQSTYVSF